MDTTKKTFFERKTPLPNETVFLSVLICVLILLSSFKTIHENNFLSFFPLKKIASTVELNKTVSDPNPLTGEPFVYTLQYRCASTIDDCIGTVITDPLPPEVEYIGLVGSPHTIAEVYDPSSHTVTFTFQNTLTAGSTGEVQVEVRFPNGVTANGTVATNTATIDATNASPVSASVSNTAFAEAVLTLDKQHASGGAVGGLKTYNLRICNNRFSGNASTGKLNVENVYVVDTLPPGAVLVGTRLQGGNLVSYDPVTNVVIFSMPDFDVDQCRWPRLTVQYPDPPYDITSTVTNTGYLYGIPIGGTEIEVSDSYTHGFLEPDPRVRSWKHLSHGSLIQGEHGYYELDFDIEGTEPLDDFCIVDTIPDGIDILSLTHGGFGFGGASAGAVSYTHLTLPTTPYV